MPSFNKSARAHSGMPYSPDSYGQSSGSVSSSAGRVADRTNTSTRSSSDYYNTSSRASGGAYDRAFGGQDSGFAPQGSFADKGAPFKNEDRVHSSYADLARAEYQYHGEIHTHRNEEYSRHFGGSFIPKGGFFVPEAGSGSHTTEITDTPRHSRPNSQVRFSPDAIRSSSKRSEHRQHTKSGRLGNGDSRSIASRISGTRAHGSDAANADDLLAREVLQNCADASRNRCY